MVQIIKEFREPNNLEKFMQMVSSGLRGGAEGGQALKNALDEQKTRTTLQERFGKEFGGIRNPQLQQMLVQNALQKEAQKELQGEKFAHEKDILTSKVSQKAQETFDKGSREQQEKAAPLLSGLQTIQRMRQIGNQGHLGPQIFQGLGLGMINNDVRRDRAEYEQLGKSLISLSSNIPIRNQKEFETLAADLYDPSLTDASREGILNAMERIISQSMQQFIPEGEKRGKSEGLKARSLEDIFG